VPKGTTMKIKEGEDNEYRQLAVNDEQQSRFLKTSTIDLTRNRGCGQDISLGRAWRQAPGALLGSEAPTAFDRY